MSKQRLIFIIAGEASGDLLGAELMTSLKEHGICFEGIGGQAMETRGLKSLFPMEELSLMGVTSILRDLPNLLGRLHYTVKTIEKMKPDAVITIDAPEFSLRVLKRLHKNKERPYLVHYVAPSVWAWRPWLAKKISRFLDGLFCLYPFEPPFFQKYGLNTTFVGHPIASKRIKKPEIKRDSNLLCLLPGSRSGEVKSLLPIFGETVRRLQQERPNLKVIIPTVPTVKALVREGVQDWPVKVDIVLGEEERDKAFERAYVALAASGTVALQLAASELPFVVAYKLGKINEWGARLLIKTPWACMVNILLSFEKYGYLNRGQKPWIPEFLQQDCTADKLIPAIRELFENKDVRAQQIQAMNEAIKLLKAPKNVGTEAILRNLSTLDSGQIES